MHKYLVIGSFLVCSAFMGSPASADAWVPPVHTALAPQAHVDQGVRLHLAGGRRGNKRIRGPHCYRA